MTTLFRLTDKHTELLRESSAVPVPVPYHCTHLVFADASELHYVTEFSEVDADAPAPGSEAAQLIEAARALNNG